MWEHLQVASPSASPRVLSHTVNLKLAQGYQLEVTENLLFVSGKINGLYTSYLLDRPA
jgi:hypothetical protein